MNGMKRTTLILLATVVCTLLAQAAFAQRGAGRSSTGASSGRSSKASKGSSRGSSRAPGVVHVRGYYRKDGTYVQAYDRRPPNQAPPNNSSTNPYPTNTA